MRTKRGVYAPFLRRRRVLRVSLKMYSDMYNILIKKYLIFLTKIEGRSMALDQCGYFMRPMEVTFSIPCRFFMGW